MMRNVSKAVSQYRGRLLVAAAILSIAAAGGVAGYKATEGKPPVQVYGEGTASLPTLNGLTNDTYQQVESHPERYQGDEIKWPCTVAGFYGTDSGGNTGIACRVYNPADPGQKSEGEVLILASPDVNVSMVKSGDSITLDGYVDEPYTGRNALGVEYSWPEISATVITDHGPSAAHPVSPAPPN